MTTRKRPSKLACKRRAKALPKKRTARAGAALAACRRPAKRRSTRNGRAKYAFYVVDNITGLVHAGNEYREDAADARNEMIDEGVPKDRVSVLTAAGVRRKFGAIKWGSGRPSVRAADKNGRSRALRSRRKATGPGFYTRRRDEVYASWKRNLAEGNTLAAAGDYECLRREFGVC